MIDLCKLLKGHEGEKFYSPMVGTVELIEVNSNFSGNDHPIYVNNFQGNLFLRKNGEYYVDGECMLFPSKDQRDWNKWAEEQKSKIPKTWSELCLSAQVVQMEISTDVVIDDNDKMIDKSHAVGVNQKLAKSALALLKIHQLIEVGYGGNITYEEWEEDNEQEKYVIRYNLGVTTGICYNEKSHIVFHTEAQAKEFLSYPENVQLVKDFYMI